MQLPGQQQQIAVPGTDSLRNPAGIAVYIHFPYCIQKCHYCDFFSTGLTTAHNGLLSVKPDLITEFLRTFYLEWNYRVNTYRWPSRVVDTIYFGGGTASLLPVSAVEKILERIRADFSVSADCEITVEGNPENYTKTYMQELKSAGINRVNIGVQTFNRDFLKSMNRYYTDESYDNLCNLLADCPVENRGADLIYGFPGQSAGQFYDDLQRLIQSDVKHLSVYSLTAEPGTKYAGLIREKKMAPPQEVLQSQIFSDLPDFLSEQEYHQYEISNFARTGYQCRHNLKYWLYEPYLAAGPGAHGFTGNLRYHNPRNTERWHSLFQKKESPPGDEIAPAENHDLITDSALNILRLTIPVDFQIFQDLFCMLPDSKQILETARSIINQWQQQHYCTVHADSGSHFRFQWNQKGIQHLDDRIEEWVTALQPG